jgi:hypothetical protein
MKWFDLRTDAGVVVHLSPLLGGLSDFANTALEQVPASKIEAAQRAALLLMKQGSAWRLMVSQLPPERLLRSASPT